MKTLPVLLLSVSLAGNALLAFFLWRTPGEVPGGAAANMVAVTSGSGGGLAKSEKSGSGAAATDVRSGARASTVAPMTWRSLQPGGDLQTLVANLRGAGFPPNVIRSVVNRLLDERFADRYAAIAPPFWKRMSQNPDQLAAQQALNDERRQMFESLLGDDARPSATMDAVSRQQRYGNPSDEKLDAVAKIERDYSDVRRSAYAQQSQSNPLANMEERRKQQEMVEQEMHADLAAVLTPEELDQFEMRNSSSASRLMSNLRSIDVTEGEYAALFRMQQASDAGNPSRFGATTPEAAIQYQAAQQALSDQMRTVLTDDRFYKYLETSDYNYAQVARTLAAFPSVSPAATYEVSKIQRDLQTEMMRISKDASIPAQDKSEQVRALLSSRESRIDELLGPEAAAAYKKQGSGRIFTSFRAARPSGG